MESEKVKEIKNWLENESEVYRNEIAYDTLDLINELESENERLTTENVNYYGAREQTIEDLAEIINKQKERIAELEKIGLNEEITVGEYLREMQRLKDRVAELEKEIEENAFYAKGYAQGIKNTYEVVMPDKLKQFAERLKEKFNDTEYRAMTKRKTISVEKLKAQMDWILHEVVIKHIDETLKEVL